MSSRALCSIRGRTIKLVLCSGRSPPALTLHLGKPALRASRGPSAGQAADGAGRPGPGLQWAQQQWTGRAGKATKPSPWLAPEAGGAPQASPRASGKNDRRASKSLARPTASCWSNKEGMKGGEGSESEPGWPWAATGAPPLQELRKVGRLTKPARKSPLTMGVKTTEHRAAGPVVRGFDTRGQREPRVLCEAQDRIRMWERAPPFTWWVVFCLNMISF